MSCGLVPSLFTGKAPYSLGCQVLASPSSHFICPIHSGHHRRLLLEQLLTWKPGFSVCFFLDQEGFRKSSIALSIIGFLRQRHPSFDSSETINFRKFIAQSVLSQLFSNFWKYNPYFCVILQVHCTIYFFFSLLTEKGLLKKSNTVPFVSSPPGFFAHCQVWMGAVSPDGSFTCGLFCILLRGLSSRCVEATVSSWFFGTSLSFYGTFSVLSLPLHRRKIIDFSILRKPNVRNPLIFLILLSK